MAQSKQNDDHLRIRLPDNGQIISYQAETIPLQGSVILGSRDVRIKAVTLKLEGRMKVRWNEDGTSFKNEKLFYEKTWDLLPSSKSYRHFHGPQEWNFSTELPSTLPPSLTDHDNGCYGITYQLKAVAERPAFQPNFSAKRQVHISRYLRSLRTTTRSAPQVFRDRTDLVEYAVRLRKGSVWRPGSTVPIDIQVFQTRPDVTRLRSVSCCLNSYAILSCKTKGGNGPTRQQKRGRTLTYLRDDHVVRPGLPLPWKKTEHLKIPNHIPADMSTAMIQIKHKLKVSIFFLQENGQIKEITTSFPITVNNVDDETMDADNEQGQQLPPYDEACSSPLCDPLTCQPVILTTSPPSSLSSIPSPSLDHEENNEQDHHLQSDYLLLTRAPSYKTVASNRWSVTSSLPGYD